MLKMQKKVYIPVFGNLVFFVLGNVHPLLFMLQDLADGAPLDSVLDGDIFLPSIGVFLVVETNFFPVQIEQTLLLVFTNDWRHISGGLLISE
jgi:hypothetical protein